MQRFSEGSNSPLRRKHVPEGDTQGLVLLPSQHQRPEGTQCSCHSPGCGGTVPGEPGTSAAALLATAVLKNRGVLLKKKREEGHDNNVKHVAAAGEKKRVPGWAEQG